MGLWPPVWEILDPPLVFFYFYRPQTKFAKVMFLHLSVILFTGRGLHPEGSASGGVCIQGVCIQGGWTDPLPIGHYGIRSTSGRYASYWNTFLLLPANEAWGKVIFSAVCVKNSVHCPSMPCRWYPSIPCRSPGGVGIPACLADFQAHTQGGGPWGVWLGGSPGPHPGRGVGGGGVGVTQHALGQIPPPPPPADSYSGYKTSFLILLECILVKFKSCYSKKFHHFINRFAFELSYFILFLNMSVVTFRRK